MSRMQPVLLGIGVGTSATKLTLIDGEGHILGSRAEPAGYSATRPGWSEADPDGWWRNIGIGVPRLLSDLDCAPRRVHWRVRQRAGPMRHR
jgi:xylulokinase